MSAAKSLPPPPALPLPPRAKPIRRDEVRVDACLHMRSTPRREGRRDSRELVLLPAMQESRGTVLDVSDALGVCPRVGGRAVSGEDPFDLGDVLTLARSGPGGLRLARLIVRALRDALDDVER